MCNVGCSMDGHLINHIMPAGDLVLISPSSAGLCQLLHECVSAVMIFRSVTLSQME